MIAIDSRILEALVDGELPEVERGEVLRRLDGMEGGWKQLALAFLVDQALREALGRESAREIVRPVVIARQIPLIPSPSPQRGKGRKSRVVRWAVGMAMCAAAFLLAFMLGTWNGRSAAENRTSREVAQHETSPSPKEAIQEPARSPHVTGPTAENVPTAGAPMPTLTAGARKELERQGFAVLERSRVVSLPRQDGQMVRVIVNEIELRYVGRHATL